MTLPTRVTVVEVGPRDGLQNEPETLPTDVKVSFIERLAAAGLPVIEATSFVRPDRVPQLADAEQVMTGVHRRAGVRYPVLVPNDRGLDRALAAGAEEVAVFTAASEPFSHANVGCGIDDSLAMLAPVITRAARRGLPVRGYVSTALGCPYQGEVAFDDVARVTVALEDLGVAEISLADTIGVGTPGRTAALLERLSGEVALSHLAVHMHDTFGQGLANTLTAVEAGVRTADTSAGGLGGCPFAPGATGNLATEDLVYALEGSGVATGVDLDRLVDTTAWMSEQLGRPPASRVARAVLAKRRAAAGNAEKI